jgi:hypothetical protein
MGGALRPDQMRLRFLPAGDATVKQIDLEHPDGARWWSNPAIEFIKEPEIEHLTSERKPGAVQTRNSRSGPEPFS